MALGVVGAVVGSYFGAPQIGFMLGSMVGGLLFPATPPASAAAPKTSSSAYGATLNILYGTMRMPGNMIWCDTIKTNSGGKGGLAGGSGGPQSTCSFAVAFCEGNGPSTGLLRVWADSILLWDIRNPGNVQDSAAGTGFFFYNGDESQVQDPLIFNWVQENVPSAPLTTPAYRGLCYIIFPGMTISKFGGRIPNITAEITNSAISSCPSIPLSLVTSISGVSGNNQMAVDWQKNVVYVLNNAGATQTITAISLDSGQSFNQAVAPVPTSNLQAFAVAQGGQLYIGGSVFNSAPIYEVQCDALGTLATFGTFNTGLTNTTSGFVFTPQLVIQQVVTPAGLVPVVVVLSYYGNYGILDGFLLRYLYGAGNATPMPYVGNHAFELGVAGAADSTGSDVWILSYDLVSGTNIAIMNLRINGMPTYDPASGVTEGVVVTTAATIDRAVFTPGSTAVGISPTGLCYDQTDNSIIIAANGGLIKWSPSLGVVWSTNIYGQPKIDPQSYINTSTLGFVSPTLSGVFVLIDTRNGNTISSQTITVGLNPGVGSSGSIYDGRTRSVITSWNTSGMSRVYLSGTAPTDYPLATLVEDIVCNRCNLPTTAIDTSLLTGGVAGFSIDRTTTGKDVLTTLAQAFFFDVIESDYKLKFVPKGVNSVVTIPQADLGSTGKAGDGNYWEHKRSQQLDIPIETLVRFIDADNDYLPNAAIAKRQNAPVPTIYTKQKVIIDLPISFHQSDAILVAKTWLWTVWTSIDNYATTLGWKYLWLDPSDTITVTLDDGDSYTVRNTSIETGADYTLKIGMVGEDAQTYSQSTSVQDTVSPYTTKYAGVAGFARPFFLNVPLLRTSDDTGGTASRVYYGAGAFTQNWPGGSVYGSSDAQTFTQYDRLTSSVTWGTAVSVLGNTATPFATDLVNTIKIAVGESGAPLFSATYLNMLNGANAALVGSEIIQFQNVTTNTDGTFTLSNLLRGRQGTEWACATHTVGETFILLDINLHTTTISLSQIGALQYEKIVPFGTFLDTAPLASVTYLGYDLKPYAPVGHTRAIGGSNLIVSWVRRTRYDFNMQDVLSVAPVGETTELYDAYVLAAPYNPVTNNYGPPATHLRVYTGLTSPTFTYLSADMATDGFSPSTSTLHVVVFQKSAAIGDGWPGAADLPAF